MLSIYEFCRIFHHRCFKTLAFTPHLIVSQAAGNLEFPGRPTKHTGSWAPFVEILFLQTKQTSRNLYLFQRLPRCYWGLPGLENSDFSPTSSSVRNPFIHIPNKLLLRCALSSSRGGNPISVEFVNLYWKDLNVRKLLFPLNWNESASDFFV